MNPRSAPSRPPEGPESAPDTRGRLLDAAEELFSRGGIAVTSLRQITAAAGANLAAVNYHFGSKQGLIAEVFARRVGPLNEERLRRLDDAQARAGDTAAPVEDVVDAFVYPALRLLRESRGGPALVRLLGRAYSEPSREVREVVFSQFGVVFERFLAALVRALPRIPREEVAARLKYGIGAMAFTMMNPRPLSDALPADPHERERIVTFLAAGFRAPAASTRGGSS